MASYGYPATADGASEQAEAQKRFDAHRYVTRAEREAALRERLRMALRELGACRELLDQNGVPREHSDFSCVPVDHADVLAEHIDEDEDNTIDDKTGPVEPADDLGLPVRTVVEDTLARPPSTGDLEPLGKRMLTRHLLPKLLPVRK